ncbi:RES family NAD+ phosphorylase [Ruegeria conchae]|uniref:RES domain-containing protein n=1 Tax=Ruegeria conchae TaxID=981384 RepID=A0A497ZSH8_9RHOB|nr:RES family NAD+ phosphorylase [Ruegeria conchae]RLK11291.1 RES domain-containing protein [Ruegeria conchae]
MITEFSGPVWRILFRSQLGIPLAPARAPEGRFHHSGQFALYASLSAEGAGIAIRRYVSPCDPPRVIQQFQVSAAHLMDLRGRADVSIVWQDLRDNGTPSPTWRFSDEARAVGADGLLYSSRSRTELSHLVLFSTGVNLIQPASTPNDWRPER